MSGVHNLADRHKPVFRLLVDGKHNREIAEALSISLRTVEQYNTQIYAILGCEGRVDLVVRAKRGDFGQLCDFDKISE